MIAAAVGALAAMVAYFMFGSCDPTCDRDPADVTAIEAWKHLREVAKKAPRKFVKAFFSEISPESCGVEPTTTLSSSE